MPCAELVTDTAPVAVHAPVIVTRFTLVTDAAADEIEPQFKAVDPAEVNVFASAIVSAPVHATSRLPLVAVVSDASTEHAAAPVMLRAPLVAVQVDATVMEISPVMAIVAAADVTVCAETVSVPDAVSVRALTSVMVPATSEVGTASWRFLALPPVVMSSFNVMPCAELVTDTAPVAVHAPVIVTRFTLVTDAAADEMEPQVKAVDPAEVSVFASAIVSTPVLVSTRFPLVAVVKSASTDIAEPLVSCRLPDVAVQAPAIVAVRSPVTVNVAAPEATAAL
jgi:hypothetical protein